MKTINKLAAFILTGSMFLVMSTGCKKLADFGDTNVNPNGSTYGETGTFLSTVEARLGSRTFGTADAAADVNPGLFAQYFAEPTYPGLSRYTLPQFDAANFYAGILNDVQVIINRNTNPSTRAAAATSGSNENQLAVARILKSYIMWTITDRWGDVPYSEALTGAANLTPKYDTQESIYKDLMKELTEAVAQVDMAGAPLKGDLIYAGNMTKWKKLANSLRMLMSMRTSKVYPAPGDWAAQQFSAAVNDPNGFIMTNADNFKLTYPGNTLVYNNPWYAAGNSADNAVSKTYTDLLAGLNDTRLTKHASNANGVPYGLATAAPTGTSWAKILEASFKQTTSTLVFVSAASSLLAQAEAIERGWITGDAKAAYDAGVTASFDQWGLTVPAGYLTTGPANFTDGAGVGAIGGPSVAGSNANTDTRLKRIQLQEYIAFYPDGVQGWANWRRTGVPDLKPTIYPATTHTQIPRRYTYGTNDYSQNLEEVTAAAARIGGDDQDTRMWWDRP